MFYMLWLSEMLMPRGVETVVRAVDLSLGAFIGLMLINSDSGPHDQLLGQGRLAVLVDSQASPLQSARSSVALRTLVLMALGLS